MPPNIADAYIMLKPREEWPDPKKPKARLVEEIQSGLEEIPGSNYELSQPIQLRFNELIAGVRARYRRESVRRRSRASGRDREPRIPGPCRTCRVRQMCASSR